MLNILFFFEGNKMNIAICDDEKRFRDFLEKNLRTYFDEKSIALNIFQFSSGEELLNAELQFDLVFLDVQMENMNGIDTGKVLRYKNPHGITIVITAYDGYLDDAFQIRAFRFLPKPLDVLRLYKALDDASELLNNEIIVFYDINSGENVRIYTNDVIYLEIVKKKTKIVTVNGTYYSKEKIGYWQNRLNGISFACPHASFIVNIDYSILHTRTQIILAKKDLDGNILERFEIPISSKNQAEIKRRFFYVLERR